MDVSGDVAFYYQLYDKLFHLVRQEARSCDEAAFFPLLLYTENIIATGLDGVYEYMYRSLGDVVVRWSEKSGMKAHATSQIHHLVSEAVAKAPGSSLRRWIMESVLSGDFLRLTDMLDYFAREDHVLRQIYPNLRYREAMFLRLTVDQQSARQMLWADVAFNWRDKHGNSLSATLAIQLRQSAVSADRAEKTMLIEAADHLDSICSERLDAYTPAEQKNGRTITLRHRDGRLFNDVILPSPLSGQCPSQRLAAQLVTYKGQTYVNGPFQWIGSEEREAWDGDKEWNTIQKEEEEYARRTYFTTPFGKRISLYEDLYAKPEDPETAYYADMGIYLDESNIFDFLESAASCCTPASTK